jgi:hypothetical protein
MLCTGREVVTPKSIVMHSVASVAIVAGAAAGASRGDGGTGSGVCTLTRGDGGGGGDDGRAGLMTWAAHLAAVAALTPIAARLRTALMLGPGSAYRSAPAMCAAAVLLCTPSTWQT